MLQETSATKIDSNGQSNTTTMLPITVLGYCHTIRVHFHAKIEYQDYPFSGNKSKQHVQRHLQTHSVSYFENWSQLYESDSFTKLYTGMSFNLIHKIIKQSRFAYCQTQ